MKQIDLGDSVWASIQGSVYKGLDSVTRMSPQGLNPVRRKMEYFVEDSVWYSVWQPVYNSIRKSFKWK